MDSQTVNQATSQTPDVWTGTRKAFFAKFPKATYADYMHARAGRRRAVRNQAVWAEGQKARAERIAANPGEIAARVAEQR